MKDRPRRNAKLFEPRRPYSLHDVAQKRRAGFGPPHHLTSNWRWEFGSRQDLPITPTK